MDGPHGSVDDLIDAVRLHVPMMGDIAASACLGVEERLTWCILHHGENVDK